MKQKRLSMKGGCAECGGICGGARDPKELLDQVFQMVEDGHLSGGDFAKAMMDYRDMGLQGAGFWGDLWSGIKKGVSTVAQVAKPALNVASMFVPALRPASMAVNALGIGKKKKKTKRRKVRKQ